MIKARSVFHIGIPVNDMERAVKFYAEVLGMKVALRDRDDMGDVLDRADLRCEDGSMVVLFQRPKPIDEDSTMYAGATHQAFMVDNDDFDLALEKMREWGVRIHNVPMVDRGPQGRGFYFFDTEGNLLQLYAPPRLTAA